MKRRDFIKATAAVSLLAASGLHGCEQVSEGGVIAISHKVNPSLSGKWEAVLDNAVIAEGPVVAVDHGYTVTYEALETAGVPSNAKLLYYFDLPLGG